MWDKHYKKMYSIKNLRLAWARLKTAQNVSYKNYYRNLFLAYELNAEENLRGLSKRLASGTYEPSEILRFYIPKHSGLHRPITFLHLDDLIVYQAIANVVAEKFWNKRREVQNITTFSNLFNSQGKESIFLFHRWQEGYRRFVQKIRGFYGKGNTWVAHFDIAAYYDTIDLELLSRKISAHAYENFTKFVSDTISKWTTHKTKKLFHGIPQGPNASDLIGEIYLLTIDVKLKKSGIKYVRYVDDIKIFGETKEEVQKGIILLERECKEMGLIPHAKKYEIINAKTVEEAIGKFPSLQSDEKKVIFKNEEEAYRLFAKAFDPFSFDISRVKYILKTSGENDYILAIILSQLGQHPELVDEFCAFLGNYSHSQEIAIEIYEKVLASPGVYSYVEGRYWQLLARFTISDKKVKRKYLIAAMGRLKECPNEYALKLGSYIFICTSENAAILKWLPYESSCLIQMMVVPYIQTVLYDTEEFKSILEVFCRRSNYDAPLAAIKELIFTNSQDLLASIVTYKDETGVIANTLGHAYNFDAIHNILNKTYVIMFKKWKPFLKKHYVQANHLAHLAYKSYYIDRNAWLNYTDAFVDVILRSFIELLKKNKVAGLPDTTDNKGKLVDLGSLLEHRALSKNYLGVVSGFKKAHKRRSKAPSSHAFDRKTLQKTIPVRQKEQKNLVGNFNSSLNSMLHEVSKYI
jgi:hypothetical protein